MKAIDPFSKGKKAKVNDKDRNLPPDVKNHQAQRLNNLQGEKHEAQLPTEVTASDTAGHKGLTRSGFKSF